jgi:hypothetical protein
VTLVNVWMTPSVSINVGATSQASFQAKDAQGTILTGKTVTWSTGGSSFGSITPAGLLTGLAPGNVTVTGTVDGVSGSTVITILGSTTTSPPPTGSSAAELPRVYLNYSFPAMTGRTIVVAAGGDFQAALNNAQRGDEIVLTAGATYTGNFVLPAKSGNASNGWIIIRSEKLSQLPSMGTRVTSSDAVLMPKIVTSTVAPAIEIKGASHGWWIAGVEVSVSPSLTSQQYGLIYLGSSGSPQTSLSTVPSDIVLDRMYIHGQPTTNMSRCVALNSARTQISDSYLAECHGKGFDSQAIWGANGPGPYKIVNNMLMGAGENIMFGGADPTIPNLVPSDIEIRRNYFYTPLAWKGVWTKKNLFETKNAARVLVEGNVLEGSWTDGQTGWGVVLKSANQSGTCNWCRSTDITIRRNLIRNVGAGINLIGQDGGIYPVDTTTRRVFVSENVVEVNQPGDLRGFQVINRTQSITLTRNVLSGSFNAAMLIENGNSYCAFTDNVWAYGLYGVFSSGIGSGTNALNAGCGTTWTWTGMTLVGTQQSGYQTTTWVSSEAQAPLAAQLRGIVQQATTGVLIP